MNNDIRVNIRTNSTSRERDIIDLISRYVADRIIHPQYSYDYAYASTLDDDHNLINPYQEENYYIEDYTYIPQSQSYQYITHFPSNNIIRHIFNYLNTYDDENDIANATFETQQHLERKDNVNIKLEPKTYRDINREKNTNCSICTDIYNGEDLVCELECEHIFHKNCIEEWFHYKNVCPLCRKDIKTN